MLFNSLVYAVFLPVVVFLYYGLPYRLRWAMLLAASYLFYGWWKPSFLILIAISTFVDYWVAIWIEGTHDKAKRKAILAMSLTANLGLLFIFKYFDFFAASFNGIFGWAGADIPLLHLILPVGISFYTFQTLSYTIDVYRGNYKAERHLGWFALYVSYFPQLVAGPIERPDNLLPQLRKEHGFSQRLAASGLRMILWGLFKKVVIADRLGVLVDAVYSDPAGTPGPLLALATVFFAFQIFCDFSGYTDIAIGSARIFGVELMVNFKAPYFSASIGEFWRRWHISLSTWFRDYVYIPLGGSRTGKWRHIANIFITFLLSGLWHGANWTFVVWGALHGLWMVLETLLGLTERPKRPLILIPRIALTFVLACLAWVFFRAENISDAAMILAGLPKGWSLFGEPDVLWARLPKGFGGAQVLLSLGLILFLQLVESRTDGWRMDDWLGPRPQWQRWSFYYAVTALLIVFSETSAKQFIYFQF